jgi:hypothetical protein
MRRLACFVLLMVAAVQPARADITAEYRLWGVIGPVFKVEVANNGNARVQLRHGTAVIRRDGILYHVQRDADGAFLIPNPDFTAYHRRITAEAGAPDLPALPDAALEIIELGTEKVGGRTGMVLGVSERGRTLPEAERNEMRPFAVVISQDRDLAPVGPLVNGVFGAEIAGALPGAADVMGRMREIYQRGTPIRIAWFLMLERTSNRAIPAEAFDLPGPVLTGEQAERRLRRKR